MALGKSSCCRTLLYLKRGLRVSISAPTESYRETAFLVVAVEGCKASTEVISLLGTGVVLCIVGYLAEFVTFTQFKIFKTTRQFGGCKHSTLRCICVLE